MDDIDKKIDDMFSEILNSEIARQCLLQHNPDITEQEIEKVWKACKGNPWDAVPIYAISKVFGDGNEIPEAN